MDFAASASVLSDLCPDDGPLGKINALSCTFAAQSWLSGNLLDRVLLRVIASLTIVLSLVVLLFVLSPYLFTPGLALYGIVGVVIGLGLYRRLTAACIAAVFWHSIRVVFVALSSTDKWLRYDSLGSGYHFATVDPLLDGSHPCLKTAIFRWNNFGWITVVNSPYRKFVPFVRLSPRNLR